MLKERNQSIDILKFLAVLLIVNSPYGSVVWEV